MKGNLQLVINKVSGYMNHVLNNTSVSKEFISGGPVIVETNDLKIKAMKAVNNNWSEASVI